MATPTSSQEQIFNCSNTSKETIDDIAELNDKVLVLCEYFDVFEHQIETIESSMVSSNYSERQIVPTFDTIKSSQISFVEEYDNEIRNKSEIIPSIHETLRKIAEKAQLLNSRIAILERFVKRPKKNWNFNCDEDNDKKKHQMFGNLNCNIDFVKEIRFQKQEMNEIMLNWSQYVSRFQQLVQRLQVSISHVNSGTDITLLDKPYKKNSEKSVQVNFDKYLSSYQKRSIFQRSRSLIRAVFERAFHNGGRRKLQRMLPASDPLLQASCSKNPALICNTKQFLLDTAITEFIKHYETLGIRFRPFLLPVLELKSLVSSNKVLELHDKSTETSDEEIEQESDGAESKGRKWKKCMFF